MPCGEWQPATEGIDFSGLKMDGKERGKKGGNTVANGARIEAVKIIK